MTNRNILFFILLIGLISCNKVRDSKDELQNNKIDLIYGEWRLNKGNLESLFIKKGEVYLMSASDEFGFKKVKIKIDEAVYSNKILAIRYNSGDKEIVKERFRHIKYLSRQYLIPLDRDDYEGYDDPNHVASDLSGVLDHAYVKVAKNKEDFYHYLEIIDGYRLSEYESMFFYELSKLGYGLKDIEYLLDIYANSPELLPESFSLLENIKYCINGEMDKFKIDLTKEQFNAKISEYYLKTKDEKLKELLIK